MAELDREAWPGIDTQTGDLLRKLAPGVVVAARAIPGGGQRKTYFATALEGSRTRELVLQVVNSGGPYDGMGITSLGREARLFKALESTDASAITPRLIAVDEDASALLTERAAGSSDFATVSESWRRPLTDDFIHALTRLHAVGAARVADVGFKRPQGNHEAGQGWLGVWAKLFTRVRRPAPLVRLALEWLSDNAPAMSDPLVICHGDLGPGNFVFVDDQVIKLVDWELSHLGDFHDDLGMLAVRGFQFGAMEGLNDALRLYEKLSGRRVDGWKVRYYRAVGLLLGAVTSLVQLDHAVTCGRPLIAMPLYLHLVPMLQLWLTEAILDLEGTSPEPVELPQADDDVEMLDVALALSDAQTSLATAGSGGDANFADILLHLKAKAHYGRSVQAAELDDIASLIGRRPSDLWEGRRALDAGIQSGALRPAELLRWSWRAAKRQSLLWPSWAELYERRLIPVTI